MAEAKLTIEQWNELLATEGGEEIAAVLALPGIRTPKLKPPASGLKARVLAALEPVGLYCQRIEVVSMAGVRRSLGRLRKALPEQVGERLELEIARGFEAHLREDLWFILRTSRRFAAFREQFGPQNWERLRQGILADLQRPASAEPDEFGLADWSGLLGDRAARTFFEVLCLHLACLAHSGPEAAEAGARITPFFDLCIEGNYPVGRIEDGSIDGAFLILIA